MKKAILLLCLLFIVAGCTGNAITGSYLSDNPKAACIESCVAEGENKDTCEMKCFGVYVPTQDS